MMDEVLELNEPVARLKVVLVGDANVGKSSIVNRYWRDTFNNNYNFTVGIDFHSKIVQTQNKMVKMQLWDTAGQERFRALLPSYLRDCAVTIIVYDITNKKSFEDLGFWVNFVKNRAKLDVKIIIVGSKCDITESREVETSTAEKYCQQAGFQLFEISSKTGENLSPLFECAAMCANDSTIMNSDSTSIFIDPSSKRTPDFNRYCNC